ncbi:hypothetical protein HTG_15820, partial [Natrinema mahii]
PAGDVRLAAGDVAYVLGRPDALRRVTERTLVSTDESASEAAADDARSEDADSAPDRTPERPRER